MPVYLAGKWERDQNEALKLRRYCDVTNNVSNLRVSNFDYAWRTDGSDIGLSTLFNVASNPGVYSAPITGSLQSGALNYAVPNPPTLAPGPFYPTIKSNGSGWRYEPIESDLPKTLALPEMNAGYPSDAQIEITTYATTRKRATIVSMTFDERWNTLWLEEEIGSGDAWWTQVNAGTARSPRMEDAVSFKTSYSATWRTAYEDPTGTQTPGIARIRVDTTLADGTYSLSALVAAGLAVTTTGYLHTTPLNTTHYSIR